MYQYANGFSIIVKNDNSEVLIRFIQSLPVRDSDSETQKREEEIVADVMLRGDIAQDLADKLHELLAENVSDEA